MVRKLTCHVTEQVVSLIFSSLPLPPSQSMDCLTQLALSGVTETQSHVVVGTAQSGRGAVGEGRLETWK